MPRAAIIPLDGQPVYVSTGEGTHEIRERTEMDLPIDGGLRILGTPPVHSASTGRSDQERARLQALGITKEIDVSGPSLVHPPTEELNTLPQYSPNPAAPDPNVQVDPRAAVSPAMAPPAGGAVRPNPVGRMEAPSKVEDARRNDQEAAANRAAHQPPPGASAQPRPPQPQAPKPQQPPPTPPKPTPGAGGPEVQQKPEPGQPGATVKPEVPANVAAKTGAA